MFIAVKFNPLAKILIATCIYDLSLLPLSLPPQKEVKGSKVPAVRLKGYKPLTPNLIQLPSTKQSTTLFSMGFTIFKS
jgi:hypothetical protein